MTLHRIGRVLRATGLKGELRVQLFRPRRIDRGPRTLIKGDQRLTLETAKEEREHKLIAVRWVSPTDLVAKLDDIDDRDTAEALKGSFVAIDPAACPASICDDADRLIGARAIEDGSDRVLGEVIAIQDNGAQALLQLDSEDDQPERLIPFVDAFIAGVDNGTVRIRVIEGLFD